jgi:HD-GYP domain-containing protein (c-di-GMP phosphodiesterase class II)
VTSIPRRSFSLTLLLVAAASGTWLLAWQHSPRTLSGGDWAVALLLLALMVGTEIFDVNLWQSPATITVSISAALALAMSLEYGPFIGGTMAMAAMLIEELYDRRPPIKMVVNVANYGLSSMAAGGVYAALADSAESPLGSAGNLVALVAAGLVFTLVNSWALALIVAPIVGTTAWSMWTGALHGFAAEMVALPALGGLIPVLIGEHPLAMLVLAAPLVGSHLSFKGFQRAQAETRATMERLADALERRDPYTHDHSIRVAEFVDGILQEMPQIPSEVADSIRAAARIHDLGKVGISDLPLNKPGPLTAEERLEIEQHPVIGAEIINHLAVYRAGESIVRHHHERWDGKGYPDRLKGEEIPLGARIVAVADTFDAMTSDRAYRRGMSRATALDEIRRHSGLQFDPQVVAAFERWLASVPLVLPTSVPEAAGAPAPLGPESAPGLSVLRGLDVRQGAAKQRAAPRAAAAPE